MTDARWPTPQGRRQPSDRERRCIGGDKGGGWNNAVDLRQDAQLECFVLGGGLDYQVDGRQIGVVGGAPDTGQGGVLVGGADLLFLNQAVQAASHGGEAALHGFGGNVHHDD